MSVEVILEKPEVTVDTLEKSDIPQLMRIAEHWVRDRKTGEVVTEELVGIQKRLHDFCLGIHDPPYYFMVLRNEQGAAIGMCGIREPEPRMNEYRTHVAVTAAELINVFLDPESTGKGFGKIMLAAMFDMARSFGYDEVIWNSGPRYEHTAWNFYNGLVGERIATAPQFYGEDGDAPVWRKILRS